MKLVDPHKRFKVGDEVEFAIECLMSGYGEGGVGIELKGVRGKILGFETVIVDSVRWLPNDLKFRSKPNEDGYWRSGYEQLRLITSSGKDFPHSCPKCGRPAYVGFSTIDCSSGCA